MNKAFEAMLVSASMASASVATAASMKGRTEELVVRRAGIDWVHRRYFLGVPACSDVYEFFSPAVALTGRGI